MKEQSKTPRPKTARQKRLNRDRQRRWRLNAETENPIFQRWDENLAALHLSDEARYTALVELDKECGTLYHEMILSIAGQHFRPELFADVTAFIEKSGGLKKLLGEKQQDDYSNYGLETQIVDSFYQYFIEHKRHLEDSKEML